MGEDVIPAEACLTNFPVLLMHPEKVQSKAYLVWVPPLLEGNEHVRSLQFGGHSTMWPTVEMGGGGYERKCMHGAIYCGVLVKCDVKSFW